MKYEWRKQEKDLYLPKQNPRIITVPEQKYIMIEGKGNPNDEEFSEKIGVLYSLAYAIRMMPKKGYTPEDYFEYTVYPLEGVWDLSEEGRKSETLNKNELIYNIMIRQPEFVTREVFDIAVESVSKKKPHKFLEEVKFETIKDGLSLQILHVGSYDNEPESFKVMEEFAKDNKFERASFQHREIYLSDFRKVEAEKLKTVLRYSVRKNTPKD
ncbi:MAG: GyrI-like domain-containing protein [Gudongella sp.]|nr:GyrI-like domain-containing protein [Gudongella sp.]